MRKPGQFYILRYPVKAGVVGVAFLDISTGEFLTAEGTADYIDKLLNNFAPKEVLIERGSRKWLDATFNTRYLALACNAATKLFSLWLSTVSLIDTPGVTSSVMPRLTSLKLHL